MPFFFCRLNPPRSDFAKTMTDAERALMGQHAAYLKAEQEKGIAVLFGPVGDPRGAWGLGILECADDTQARSITGNDPVVKSGQGFSYDVYPMPSANLRKANQ
jgi:uncharacterized protein YciI